MKNSIAKVMGYMLVIVLGLLVALPNVLSDATLSRFPSFMPHERVSLGLDLRGGSHLVLEVDRPAMVDEWLQGLAQEARTTMLEARIKTRSIRRDGDALAVTLADPAQLAAARQALAVLNNPAITVTGTGLPELDVSTSGGDTVHMAPTEQGITSRLGHAVDQSLEVIRQRVDQVGVAEPTIQRVGGDRVLVQLPGEQDPSRLRALLGTTAKMSFHLLGEPGAAGVETLRDDEGRSYPVQATVLLAGDRLTDARVQFDQQGGQPVVSFRFDGVGAERFARITSDNVGRPFAIVLDDKVLSAPVIREPITGGAGQISGDFSVDEANTLAALLRAGALPAKLTVIEERTVGADLGGDAIEMGIVSGLAGFGLVVAFIVALYGAWGLLAVLALTLNVILTFAGLTIVGATLTLPGIAGIVLGIGLAVDANVLINERIREEAAKGRGAFAAIDQGFAKAYSTIIDSNVTALIATVLLFWFGSGPVRGFAVTMGLGIAISMFTAVSVVRVAMVAIARRWKLKTITIKPLLPFKLIKDGTRIDFMKARLFGIGVSAFLSISSIILFITPGLNYGVDFKGGIQLELSTTGPADLGRLRSGIEGLNLGEVALQEFGDSNHVMLRLERQPGGEQAQTDAVTKVREAIQTIDASAKIERIEVVGPKVSGELATAGLTSVILASLAMLVYIWVRFDWPFAVGAIATLILDVTKTIGFFALTGLDFNLTAIAALLTLVGYSVNDKVVVYDRMRENMRLYKAMPFRDLINLSINETLARSLYTSATAFLAMLPMAVWGGSAVESFAVPMVFGIFIAASSSVFIAAPILLFLGDWRNRRKIRNREALQVEPA